MRDRIRQRLEEYRAEAHERITIAVHNTKRKANRTGNLDSGGFYLAIEEDHRAGFAEYMDRSIKFIRAVAPGSWAEYADELREGGSKLKQEIISKMDRANFEMSAFPENPTRVQLRNELDKAFDQLIKRKVEDFEWGIEGEHMNATTQNTVNIINSNISHGLHPVWMTRG